MNDKECNFIVNAMLYLTQTGFDMSEYFSLSAKDKKLINELIYRLAKKKGKDES